MSNRFFNNTFNVALGSQAKSAQLKTLFTSIESGCALIQGELDSSGGKGGITTLAGFPASFYGSAYKLPRVNVGESALEFVSSGNLPIKTVSATTYTLLSTDAGYLIVFTAATAVTVTVATNVTQAFAQGDVVYLMQKGAGAVTLSGVTLDSSDGLLSTRTTYALIAASYLGADEWLVFGDRNVGSTLGYAVLTAANTFTKAQSVTPVALTDGATINTDASLSNSFYVTLAGTGRTLANPTNLVSGTRYRWYFKQDATGSRTVTSYGAAFKFIGGVPTLTTTANAVDLIEGEYNAVLGSIYCIVSKNFT